MTILTIDDKEYDTKDLSADQQQIVNILNVGTNSVAMLDHMLQCVKAIQQMKTTELKSSLEATDDAQSELKL